MNLLLCYLPAADTHPSSSPTTTFASVHETTTPHHQAHTSGGRWRSRIKKRLQLKRPNSSGSSKHPDESGSSTRTEPGGVVTSSAVSATASTVNESKLSRKQRKVSEKQRKAARTAAAAAAAAVESAIDDDVNLTNGMTNDSYAGDDDVDEDVFTPVSAGGDVKLASDSQDDTASVISDNQINEAKSSEAKTKQKRHWFQRSFKPSSRTRSQSADTAASDSERRDDVTNDVTEEQEEEEEEEREEEKTIEEFEKDEAFMEEFEAMVALRRDKVKRGSRRHKRGQRSGGGLLGASLDVES